MVHKLLCCVGSSQISDCEEWGGQSRTSVPSFVPTRGVRGLDVVPGRMTREPFSRAFCRLDLSEIFHSDFSSCTGSFFYPLLPEMPNIRKCVRKQRCADFSGEAWFSLPSNAVTICSSTVVYCTYGSSIVRDGITVERHSWSSHSRRFEGL